MMSLRKIKERLQDICNGAGYVWLEYDQYFESQDGLLKNLGDAIQACERAFELGENTRIRAPRHLHRMESLDSFAELIKECLQFDVGS